MSKSKLSNYKYQGALASLSSSVKKVLDIDGRFIDASKSEFSLRSAKGAKYDSQGASAEQSEARRPWLEGIIQESTESAKYYGS